MLVRRSQMEILVDILKAVADGKQKPTHIMYRANLSWTRLKNHLSFLMGQDLLEEGRNKEGSIYMITTKGKEALGYYGKLRAELYHKRTIPTEVYVHYK